LEDGRNHPMRPSTRKERVILAAGLSRCSPFLADVVQDRRRMVIKLKQLGNLTLSVILAGQRDKNNSSESIFWDSTFHTLVSFPIRL
jgi:hypothetical protein